MKGEPGGRGKLMLDVPEAQTLTGLLAVLTMKKHPLVVMVVVLIRNLLLPMGVTFPQLLVHHLLDLQRTG